MMGLLVFAAPFGRSFAGSVDISPADASANSPISAPIQSKAIVPVAWSEALQPLALPADVNPIGMSDAGVVLYSRRTDPENPYSPQLYYLWDHGKERPVQVPGAENLGVGAINREGDLSVGYFLNGVGTQAILRASGELKVLQDTSYHNAIISRISNHYATGQLLTALVEIPTGEGSRYDQTWSTAIWDFATGGYQAVGASGKRLNQIPTQLSDINDYGDFIARKWHYPEDPNEPGQLVGYFLNEQALDFFPLHLNNLREVVGQDTAGVPILRRSSQRIALGNEPGYTTSLNDGSKVLVDLEGELTSLLWEPKVAADGSVVYEATDLYELTAMDVYETLQINNADEILFRAVSDDFSVQSYLLTSARLGVDFDRDGVINTSRAGDNPDRELARRKLPWFFWINDDNDAGETDGNDIPGGGANAQDAVVNGTRDLVDFFPVHLDIAPLLQSYPASDSAVSYKLVQADSAANFLATDLTPDTAGDYLRDPEKARLLGSAAVTPITDQGVTLDPGFLGKILSDNQGIILVEARKETHQPLRLEVRRNGVLVAKVELPLSFAGVETMFRHKNLVGAVGVKQETPDRISTPNWPDAVLNNQAFVFVHGYNVNQQQARGWQAEFFKRLWWSGSNAEFWAVTWYGTDSQIVVRNSHLTSNYQINVIHALGTAPKLAEFIQELKIAGGEGYQVNVAGHSLGNMVVSSAIADHLAPVARYFMIDAAVAAEAYDGAAPDNTGERVVQPADSTADMPHTEWNKELGGVYPAILWASNWYQLFQNRSPADGRATLTWRDRFAPRPGVEYYDFHSTGEEVLDHTPTTTPNLGSVLAVTAARALAEYLHFDADSHQPAGYKSWQYQEQLKGRTITGKILGSNFGGWGFNALYFKKSPGGAGGKGPLLAPMVLRPNEISPAMLSQVFTPEVLREEPFFRPGGRWRKVGSWSFNNVTGVVSWNEENLGMLYDPSAGSGFAFRQRDALLARMIPAMSPAAGRIPVPRLTADAGVERNFDMNGAVIRPRTGQNPPWPADRGQDFRWWHSDLREVAYPFVRGLYRQLVISGSLGQSVP